MLGSICSDFPSQLSISFLNLDFFSKSYLLGTEIWRPRLEIWQYSWSNGNLIFIYFVIFFAIITFWCYCWIPPIVECLLCTRYYYLHYNMRTLRLQEVKQLFQGHELINSSAVCFTHISPTPELVPFPM